MGSANPLKISRFRLHHFQTLVSTQVEARDRHYSAGDVIMADTQTTGYGRRGRTWQSPPGNLYCTMVEDWTGYQQLSWLPYAVGLGLYDAIHDLLPATKQLRLKWPNDLLINGAKLSGILLEVEDDRLLIGIGMNVCLLPETDQVVTTLNDHVGTEVKPQQILEKFLPRFQFWCDKAVQQGFPALRDIWLSRAAFLGQEITARLANGDVLTGIFKDLNEQGALVLQTERAHHTITTADIYLKQD